MKLVLLCLFVLFIGCGQYYESQNKELMIDFYIIEKLESEKYYNIEGSFYSAEIDIVNNTDSVVSFWIMSCS